MSARDPAARLDKMATTYGWSSAMLSDARAMLSSVTPVGAGAAARYEDPQLDLPERYEDLGRIGEGGQGDVRLVCDHKLGRLAALKLLKQAHESARTQFQAEVSVTAALQHPGIVPIYDAGTTASGRPWYAMRYVEGRTLSQARAEGVPLRRLVDALARVCEAMAYAHTRDVVHLDLKPSNILLGPFGEVLVMDWGLAGELSRVRRWPEGAMAGTPAFMPPEQAAGRWPTIAATADVYALGATLAYVLSGRADRPDDPEESGSTAGRQGLEALAWQAMAPEAADRLADAQALGDAIRRWLDGEIRRDEARAYIERARERQPEAQSLRGKAAELEAQAAASLAPVPSYAPVEQKREGWRLEDKARACRREARRAELEVVQHLRSALELDPEADEARQMLNAHYRARLLDAEAARDADAVETWATQLRLHDGPGNVEWLKGDGRLTLVTDPPGAQATLYRCVEQDRRLVPVLERALPMTPIVNEPLAMGSYVITLEAPGRAPVKVPVYIERGHHWNGVRPGDTEPLPIVLPEASSLAEDDVIVPAGWFIAGGDPEAIDALERQRVWVDGFIIKAHPVTNAEYIEFLNNLIDSGQPEEALRLAPDDGSGGRPSAYAQDVHGHFLVRRALNFDWQLDGPIIRINWFAAQAYIAWRSARDRSGWRLPHSLEWEKTARGVDGRLFPMGDFLDPTWACMATSHSTPPAPSRVSGCPDDISVFGAVGMAGNVGDLCQNWYARKGNPPSAHALNVSEDSTPGEYREVRGGFCTSQLGHCRSATRLATPPDRALATVGFRLCRSL